MEKEIKIPKKEAYNIQLHLNALDKSMYKKTQKPSRLIVQTVAKNINKLYLPKRGDVTCNYLSCPSHNLGSRNEQAATSRNTNVTNWDLGTSCGMMRG